MGVMARLLRWVIGGRPIVPAGRNDPCPCGSGSKYKRCCLDSDRSRLREARTRAAAAATNYFGTRAELANKALENANAYRRPKLE